MRSTLRARAEAPRQGYEGAPEARLELEPGVLQGMDGLEPGQEIVVLIWLHLADRGVLAVHPRDDPATPLTGVFATRSPDRPNPIGLHRVRILRRDGGVLEVRGLEAIDGTPIVDIKPVLSRSDDR